MQDFCRRITEAASRAHSLGDSWGSSACGESLCVSELCSSKVHLSLSDSLAAQLTWPAPSLLPPSLVPLRIEADVEPVSGTASNHDRQPSLQESMTAQLLQPSCDTLGPLLVPVSTDQVPCSSLTTPSQMSIFAQSSPLAQMLQLEANSGSQPKREAAVEPACKWPHSSNPSMGAASHKEHVARTQYGGADATGNPGSSLLERMASGCNTARQPRSSDKVAVQLCEVASQSFSSGAEEDTSTSAVTQQEAHNLSAANADEQAVAQETSSTCTIESSAEYPASVGGTGHAQVRLQSALNPNYRFTGSSHDKRES